MLQRFLIIALTLCSLTATAQWQQTGSKVRYVNGLGIPTKDTAAGVLADSSQILIRPADSSLYVKYKRTWVKVGGGSVSGTTNRVSKFTGATTLGNSSIVDSASSVAMTITPGGNVGISSTTPGYKLDVNGIARVTTEIRSKNTDENVSYFTFEENTNVNSATFISGDARTTGSMGLWTNSLERMRITSGGNALIGTTTDNGVDKLQVSGGMNVSARATAQNLSVTNSAQITNNLDMGSGTANTNLTMLANSSSSGWAGRILGNNATGNFEFYHRNNSPTFTFCFLFNANAGKGGSTFYDNASVIGDGWLNVNSNTNNGVDKLNVVGSASMTGMKQAYLARTTAYNATTSDYLIDCTTGTFTITLFAASGNAGRILIIKNSGTGTITVDGNGAETIDGATTQTLSTQWSRITIMCDGTNWKIISN